MCPEFSQKTHIGYINASSAFERQSKAFSAESKNALLNCGTDPPRYFGARFFDRIKEPPELCSDRAGRKKSNGERYFRKEVFLS